MIIKYKEEEFKLAKSRDLLNLECECCHKIFGARKKDINWALNCTYRDMLKYCGRKCSGKTSRIGDELNCTTCGKLFYRNKCRQKLSKNYFCSSMCAYKHNKNNFLKKYGTRRSKLEKWLEVHLILLYPTLNIVYNSRMDINAELDIYIPSLKLAFELNGIFHYEPIYGKETLNKVKTNDNRKFQACIEKEIELCIIDTSKQRCCSDKSSQKYLDIITKIINEKLAVG